MKSRLKLWLPLFTVLFAIAVAVVMVARRPRAEAVVREPVVPLVRIVRVRPEAVPLVVRTQGTVVPRAEIDLVPEVSGRVTSVADALTAGGFFSAGETLFTIDRRDYDVAVRSAEAEVAQARVAVDRERAEAEVARREWAELRDGEPPALVARLPQLAEARARLDAARANLDRARLDLERTTVAAPFDGRVRSERIDVGQVVSRGEPLARLYAVDSAEVRLPLPDEQLAFVELPLTAGAGPRPEVRLRARFAGRDVEWVGRVVRTEGELDPANRMVHAIAHVDDPYGGDWDVPLAVGLFVDAEIVGPTVSDLVVIPRSAVHAGERVLVVTDEDRLRWRDVSVLRFDGERALVDDGLSDGDRVCLSNLGVVADGMRVRFDEAGGGVGS